MIAENWRLERSRYMILGSRCTKCDAYFFPTKILCGKCHNDEFLEEYQYDEKCKLVEWTRISDPTNGFTLSAPYHYGVVELEHGVKISVQITSVLDEEKLVPGAPMRLEFRRLFEGGPEGILVYGFKARPLSKNSIR